MKFVKGELVWFDVGGGQEPGVIVDVSTTKKHVTVQQTNAVTPGGMRKTFQIEDMSRIRHRAVHSGRSNSNNDAASSGRIAPGHRTWFDEEAGINDMIQLSELSEESILQNLRIRFTRNIIYTSIGSILVAVNPYKMFPDLYSLDTVKAYENVPNLIDLPPHLFAIGSAAFHQIVREQEDQVIIISGESGAGKTESTKLIMRYLAAVNKSASNLVTEQILEANPLLESFGNAKTIRNDNSSRFGKYLSIFFSKEGTITGAKITEYLLEKSRICTHGEDERNYHVFYELLAGLNKEEKSAYGLQEEKNYYYLNQGGDHKMTTKNDAHDFQALKSAMQVLNFSQTECDTMWKLLAAVLHFGNIRFKAKQVEYQAEGVVVERDSEIRWIAHLLQIPDTGITSALTSRTTEARNERLLTPLNRDQAFDARDAIAKALYSRLFTWLVDRINYIVAQNQNRTTSIALLDIFGFEDFKENSFEQLCINYANETLQFYFNQHIFKLEQQEYAKEKIIWQQIEFADNQPVLDLIAKKPVGILHLLDDESSFPKATDQSFLEKCHYNHGTNALYQRPRTLHPSFAIKHYAGQVSYNVNGFLDKNRDTLRADVIELFIGSGLQLVSKMFQEWKDSSDFVKTVKRGAGRFVTMKPRTPTVSARFQESLLLLVENMSKCRPHFIRCIKPNNNKAPMVFESPIVLDQLKYTGMLETIRIRMLGYPVRIKYTHFVKQFVRGALLTYSEG